MNLVKDGNKIKIYTDNQYMNVSYVKYNIIHCSMALEEIIEEQSIIIDKKDSEYETSLNEGDAYFEIAYGKITLKVDKKDAGFTFIDSQNCKVLLKEAGKEFNSFPVMKYTTGGEEPVIKRVKTVDGERNFIQNLREESDHEALCGRLYFDFDEDEGIFGLGQGEDGVYNYRNHTQYLYQHNMRIPMPMFVSTKGYGVMFDASCLMTFNDTEVGSYMYFDAIKSLSYYLVTGDSFDEIISGFRYLTGKPSMLPKWAFGYIQSKEQYYTAKELLSVAEKYRELNVPLDCVVQDWNSWPKDMWGQKSLDQNRYEDMKECSEKMHELGVHTMVSVWPNMNTGTDNHTELFNKGYMLNDYATYDAFNEEAREIYWRQAKEGLFEKGFDSWWCDSTEPFSGPDWSGDIKREPWVRYNIVGLEHKKYLDAEKANIYSLMHAKGMYDGQRKDYPDRRVLNLTRSGYASGYKYGAILWSGDITASWQVMKKQIAEGLNMAMSGYPYWTLDIGGFFTVGKKWQNRGCSCNNDPTGRWFWKGRYDEGVKDKGFCELYTRWIQFGAFLPMFRSHGTDTPREIWNFGKKGDIFYDSIEKYINLRYSLMPYIYSLAGDVILEDATIMRSLLFDFASDKKAAEISTEYMFGKSILVCPVLKPMYYEAENQELETDKKWDVYLPEGCNWYDFYTCKKYDGGQRVTVDAPIDVMPLFVREGSIIPRTRGLQYAMQKNQESLELHVYSGSDAEFNLYDDAGDDYSYEKGEFSRINLKYSDSDRQLIIGAREGSFKGMDEEFNYIVYLNGQKVSSGKYSGDSVVICLE